MKKRISIIILLFSIMLFTLVACVNKLVNNTIYNKEQSLILLLSKKQNIEKVCQKEIWSSIYDIFGEEYSFKELFFEDMKNFIIDLNTLSMMAKKEELELDLNEKEKLKEIAGKYFEEIKKSKAYIFENIKKEDVEDLFINYRRALKMKEELLKKTGCEISENEARVILVDRIICSSKDEAIKVRENLVDNKNIENNFIIENELKIKKGSLPKQIEDEIFDLNNDEYSDIIEYKGKYYIFKILKSYDEKETKKNKNDLLNKKSLDILSNICTKFRNDENIKISNELWNDIKKESDKNLDIINFFDFYEENFNVSN